MHKETPTLAKKWIVLSLALVTVMAIAAFPSASAAVNVSNFTLDKSAYNPGDAGTATVQFLNTQGILIRITAVNMNFNYFYQDGRVYAQAFIVSGLSMNVTDGSNSSPIAVKFSLPSDIAGGYFVPELQVTFNQLSGAGTWGGDRQDNSAATKALYAQSPYYQLFQSAQTVEYIFIVATVILLATTGYFAMRYWSLKGPNPSR